MKAHVNAIVGALVLLLTVAVLAAPVAAAERLRMGDICEKNDSHTPHGEKRTTFGRLLMCGLIFGMLLSAIPAVVAASEVVTFNDPNLEAAVRDALGKPVGDITDEDMAGLDTLDASLRGITDLSGLEYAVNLQTLHLYNNQISDLSPLAGLTNLEGLGLGVNQISDLSPLAGLTNLQTLGLWANQISDISPLAGLTNLQTLGLEDNQISDLGPLARLTNLEWLYLGVNQIRDLSPLARLTNLEWLGLWANQISDLSPLADLTNLEWLGLWANQISDISPLAGLKNLEWLGLGNNQIRDISPLVDNGGIGSDDRVWLEHNYLDLTPGSAAMNDINTLKSRGVTVGYEPQNPNNPPTITTVTVPTDPQLPGSTIQVTGTFTDPDPGDIHTATWTWGDGATSEGTVDEATGTVTGSHVYTAPGTYTITLTVTDSAGSSGTDTATITVQTPAEATADLSEQVVELGLPKGIGNAFTVKLDQAIAALNSGDRDGARDVLNAFINQMKALKGKKVAAEDADALIAMAQKIIDSI